MVKVTQADRKAAWPYANFGHLPDRQERERWFSGYYDNSPVGRPIQAFARHRQSAIGELCEGLAWYGEQARLARLNHSEGDAGRAALSEDGGAKAEALLSKHSPDAPGQHAGTRATESGDGDA